MSILFFMVGCTVLEATITPAMRKIHELRTRPHVYRKRTQTQFI